MLNLLKTLHLKTAEMSEKHAMQNNGNFNVKLRADHQNTSKRGNLAKPE